MNELVRQTVPNKPIRYVVNTHAHYDHAGGLRQYVAEGITVITHESNKAFFEQAWARPRTVEPDPAPTSNKPMIETVGDKRVLSDRTRTVELYYLPNHGHHTGQLIAYLPKERILMYGDGYNPPAGDEIRMPERGPEFAAQMVERVQRVEAESGADRAGARPRRAVPEPADGLQPRRVAQGNAVRIVRFDRFRVVEADLRVGFRPHAVPWLVVRRKLKSATKLSRSPRSVVLFGLGCYAPEREECWPDNWAHVCGLRSNAMHRFFRAVTVTALAVGAADVWLATDLAAAQAPAATPNAWSPARLPDGQPDVQGEGFWSADIGTDEADDIEKGSDVLHAKMAGRAGGVVGHDCGPAGPHDSVHPRGGRRSRIGVMRTATTRTRSCATRSRGVCWPVCHGSRSSSHFGLSRIRDTSCSCTSTEHAFRVIPLDGRPHLAENIKLWRGDSRGRWEGNTLVVDVTNHDARTWFDQAGAYHSDALHVVERFTFVDANTINYEATLEDPKAYTRPWKIAFTHKRTAEQGYEILEDACYEGLHAGPTLIPVMSDS